MDTINKTNKTNNYTAVILAGGLGIRMRSDTPKGLVPILEKPMIYYIISELLKINDSTGINNINNSGMPLPSDKRMISADNINNSCCIDRIDKIDNKYNNNSTGIIDRIIIVIGHKGEQIKDYIQNEHFFKNCGITIDFAVQDKYLGTGDAAKQAAKLLKSISKNNSNSKNSEYSAKNNNGTINNNKANNSAINDDGKTNSSAKNNEITNNNDNIINNDIILNDIINHDAITNGGNAGNILILPCDTPLITKDTLYKLIKFHNESDDDLTILSFETENPFSYGRILKDDKNFVKSIIEQQEIAKHPDNNALQNIKEVNSAIYAVKLKHFINFIDFVDNNNSKKEYYLTDIISIFYSQSLKVQSFIGVNDYNKYELTGVNSKIELMQCSGLMQKRIINYLIEKQDVNFISTDNIYIGSNVVISEKATLYPGCFLSGSSKIGENAVIECGAIVKNSAVGKNSVIKSYSVLEDVIVGDGASIGPFARLRPKAYIKNNAKIGNFVEIKNSVIGENSKALHLSYIGDSEIGDNVNIGAGVITCNYDGFNKHKTIIKDNCFIGSDSQLIAPVTIEKDSYVASGTTVVKNVPEGSLALSRADQINKEGWVLKRLKKLKKLKNTNKHN
ncbi:MAG: bifunctional UDP-N-acetylglucosamine diphosphorylase/glucosamine-1-phosphate N-acetyltransferase GlmU [bacterium]